MCTYLDQVGSTYYFRRGVPVELRPFIRTRSGAPRTEWKMSLGTKDREAAKRMIPDYTATTNAVIDAARAKLAAGHAQNCPADAAQRQVTILTERDAAFLDQQWEQGEMASADIAVSEARQESRAHIYERFKRAFKKSTAEMTPEEAAAFDIVRDMRHEWTLEREQEMAQRATRAEKRRGVDLPLLTLFDAYAADQKIKDATAKEWRSNLDSLVAFLGHDNAVAITTDDLDRWREHLAGEKTRRGTLREPRTIKNGYFTPLRATFAWAVEKRKLRTNVAKEIVIRVPRKAKLREREFTSDEAKAILAASLKPVESNISPEGILARRWIPWLCAYTGARVNEISQLRGVDVAQVDGIWSIRITPEAGTVKANTARTVPLHPHLIEQGFLKVIEGKGDAPIFYSLDRTRKPGSANRHFKKVGERLAAWVRDSVGITDPNVQPNHAWRHLFKTRAVAAGIAERVHDAITGHAAKSVGQTYGSVPLKTMLEAMEKMPRFTTGD